MQKFRRMMILASLTAATVVLADTPATVPPPPTTPIPLSGQPTSPRPARVIPSPSGPIAPGNPVLQHNAGPISSVTVPVTNIPKEPTIVFDSDTKTYDAKVGEASAPFVFNLTNVWTNEVIIERTQTSCGCTVAQLPSQPWHVAPGTNGQIKVTVALAGKPPGLITKQVTVYTSVGMKMVTVKVNNPPPAPPVAMTEEQRKKNAEQAMKDRQAVFHAVNGQNCAECHVDKGRGKLAKALYDADCGICHDSPHRAQGVPDLHAIANVKQVSFDYFKEWITDGGKTGTMMPAFGMAHGGPLSEPEINSVASYLAQALTQKTITNASLIKKP